VNIKPGRVAGWSRPSEIHNLARTATSCMGGGMLEAASVPANIELYPGKFHYQETTLDDSSRFDRKPC
jgi:hypothetical protein